MYLKPTVCHNQPAVSNRGNKPTQDAKSTGYEKPEGTVSLGSRLVERGGSVALVDWLFMFVEFTKLGSYFGLWMLLTPRPFYRATV